MIIKKENQVELAFGNGDICITGSSFLHDKTSGLVTFMNQEPRNVGDVGVIIGGTEIDSNDFPVIMTFTKKESIDVLIDMLTIAKTEMVEIMQPKDYIEKAENVALEVEILLDKVQVHLNELSKLAVEVKTKDRSFRDEVSRLEDESGILSRVNDKLDNLGF